MQAVGRVVALLLGFVISVALGFPASAQDKIWKHGIINPKADAGILAMVGQLEFGKRYGLKVELINFKDDQLGLKALIAGEVDSFEGGPQGVFAADSKGGDARLLGCHWTLVPHGIYAKSTIKDVRELKGKRIATSAPNSMPDMLARSALEKFGIDAAGVKLAAVGGDRERYQALVGGVVDAAVISNEFQPIAPKDIYELVSGREALPNLQRICIASTAAKLKARGEEAVKFLAAEMSALRFALSHRTETIALTKQITQEKPDDPRAAFVFDDAVQHRAVDVTIPLDKNKFEWVQDQLMKAGKIAKPLPVDEVIAPEYRERALKLAGQS